MTEASALLRLPFSEIKVDKTFVANSSASAESISIYPCNVDLGHSLGLRVTIESV